MEPIRRYSRRSLLKFGVGIAGMSSLAACAPAAAPQVVEKEVTVIVEGTPQVQVVKETVVVQAEAAPVELRWACYDLREARNKTIADCKDAFEAQNPGIKVVIETRPGDGYWDKLQTEFAGGTSPDVTINQYNWVIPGAARGMFMDLKPFMELDDFQLTDWYDMEGEWGYQGGVYGTLLYATGSGFIINKTLLEKAGLEFPSPDWTWDDELEYAQKLTIPEENQWGLLDPNAGLTGGGLSQRIHMNGGSVLNELYNKCTLTEEAATEAFKYVADLVFKHAVAPPPAVTEGQDLPIYTGKAAMWWGYIYRAGQMRDAAAAQGFEWDFAGVPKHPETGAGSMYFASNAWSALGNTRYRDESWKLVKFLGDIDGQRLWMLHGLPGWRSLVDSQEFRDLWAPQDINLVVDEYAKYGHDGYPTADFVEWNNAMSQEISAIWSGEATVDEALTKACLAADEVFARRPPYYEKFAPAES